MKIFKTVSKYQIEKEKKRLDMYKIIMSFP